MGNLFEDPSNATIYYCGRLLISSTYIVRHISVISLKVRCADTSSLHYYFLRKIHFVLVDDAKKHAVVVVVVNK